MTRAPEELLDLLQATHAAAREAAWTRFLTRFSPLLLHTARKVAHEHDRAMDAYAHLLEQLHQDDCRRLRHYVEDPRAQFTTWLVIVARRVCIDFLRHRYGRPQRTDTTGSGDQTMRRRLAELVAEQIDEAGPIPDPAVGPDEELRRRNLTSILQACLASLPPDHRLLLAMRFEDGLSVREIAKTLHYPTPFHVYRMLNSLLGELRLALRRRGVRDAEP
jgi:RNA polymerase sigma factor (sigma-70 family)